MIKTKRQYSKEFKEKAVSLSYQRGNISELADELGISVSRIYKWRTQERKQSNPSSPCQDNQDEQLEIKKLKKELQNAQLELEILKKAIHIFSKKDGSITNL
jgi:transposase